MLTPGQLVGNYKIVRLLGQGGMGAVYEAVHQQIERRAAIKVLSPELSRSPQFAHRFRNEARAVNLVRHPGLVEIYELGQLPDGTAYIIMEFLEGEPLGRRLDRSGQRLATLVALAVARRIALALAAAHEKDIVHRDLKPDNVMLIPDAETPGRERVKVLDFGIAKFRGDPHQPTTTGVTLGTVDYMAPEQCLAAPQIDGKVDVYALGVMLYEMLTGRRPFESDELDAVMRMHILVKPPPPRQLHADIPEAVAALVLEMLAKKPAERPTMAEAAARLGVLSEGILGVPSLPAEEWAAEDTVPDRRTSTLGQALGQSASGVAARPGRHRGLALLAIVLAGLVLLGLGAARWLRRPASATGRRAVAVLGFQNLSGQKEADWISGALAELLRAELSAGERLRVIPGEGVARMKRELGLTDADSHGREVLERIRRNLGPDLVVGGSYLALGTGGQRRLRVVVRLQDTATGEVLATAAETGAEAELLDLLPRLGTELRRRVGSGDLSTTAASGLAAMRPRSPEAARLYAEGLSRLRAYDLLAARELLERAVAADPGYPLAHAALAEAFWAVGNSGKGREAMRRAWERARGLPREEALLIEGGYRGAMGEREKEVEIYRSLWTFYPDNLEYGLRLMAAQKAAGQYQAALDTGRALRRLPPPAGDDPRIDLIEGRAAFFATDLKTARAALERAAEKGRARQALVLVLDASHVLGWMALERGEPERALALAAEVRQLATTLGDEDSFTDVAAMTGCAHRWLGNLSVAQTAIGESLRGYDRRGTPAEALLMRGALADILCLRGRIDEARRYLQEAFDLEAGQPAPPRGYTATMRSSCTLLSGDLAEAERWAGRALAVLDNPEDRIYRSLALWQMGEVLLFKDDLAGARQRHAEALALREAGDLGGWMCQSHTALAGVALEQGRAAEAEALARKAVAAGQRGKEADHVALAQGLLARSLLAQGRLAEAREVLGAATERTRRTESLVLRLAIAPIAARIQAASGRAAERAAARTELSAALEEARRAGLMPAELEIRLAIAELEQASGQRQAARAHLRALAEEAVRRGLRLLARKAGDAAKR